MAIKTQNNIRYWFKFKQVGNAFKSQKFEISLLFTRDLNKEDVLKFMEMPNGAVIFSSEGGKNLVLTPDALNELSKGLSLFVGYERIDQ